jgi:hypothetical protein
MQPAIVNAEAARKAIEVLVPAMDLSPPNDPREQLAKRASSGMKNSFHDDLR